MDSRLQRRIKWWKKQLRKNAKQKGKHFDAEVKKKPQAAKALDKAVDSISDENASENEDVTPLKLHDRKRKRKEDVPEPISEDASFSQPKKKKKKNDTFNESAEDVKEDIESTVKKKYILFIGNIPFSATVEDIIAHFQRAGIKVDNFRLLTKKSGSSKGCGFLELKSSKQMQAGLKLHHTKFDSRRINVELSCGGGGKNDKRKEKIKAKNRKLQKQRTKKRKKTSKTESTDQTVTSE